MARRERKGNQAIATSPRFYAASLSGKAKLITYAVGFGVGLGVPLLLAIAFYASFGDPVVWLLPILFASILVFARAFRPIGYRVSRASLEVVRPMGAKSFDLQGIASVQFPASRPPGIVLGLFRVDGFYGAWGLYWNSAWGRFRVYVTNAANRVEIGFKDGRRMILSPDDPGAFVADLRALLTGGA